MASVRWLQQEIVMEENRAAAMEDVFRRSGLRVAADVDKEKKAADPEEIVVKV